MKYCPTSTVFRNPASIQIFITRSCCVTFDLVLGSFANEFYRARISIEGLGVIIKKFAGANIGSDCPANTGLTVLV